MRLLLPALAAALALPGPARAAQFTVGPHHFTLPDGFTIEVAAPPELAPRPIEADFDEQGRLYVTDSAGSNDKVAKQLADKPHRVLRLEDTDGDGVFDKSVVFADKMMFPEGCLWHDGSLYVSAPPSIWKLTDTNNDGVADVRVEWFKGRSLGGCANDLHGPYLGPDAWIYWCKGGFERQTNLLGNGKTFVSRASQIYRARPDGTGLEPIMTGGMDNPVGLAWSPEGELFLCGTFFQHPGGGKRDGIIHVIYGGVYGKENDALEGHPRTGELMPIMTHLGPAAPCGMARYESAVFGSDYQGNLFVCNFNLHKISRHIPKPSGSTYTTLDTDFLVSDNTDFHPTDVFEDADGSLLVVDTGGWYKLCCPTSQLQKPDVLGAIYRIRRRDAPKVDDPRGLKLAWERMTPDALVKLLDEKRPVVLKRATASFTKHATSAVEALETFLKQSKSIEARRNAVWALTQMPGPKAREAVYAAFPTGRNSWVDPQDTAVQVALYSVGLWRDRNAYQAPVGDSFWAHLALSDALGSESIALRRISAQALGRIGVSDSASMLLRTLGAGSRPPDRALQHALAYALIELTNVPAAAKGLESSDPSVLRTALIALDQMDGGGLKPEQVTPLLVSTEPVLKQTANWIISHHPEWAPQLATYIQQRFAVRGLKAEEREELEILYARFAGYRAVQEILAAPLMDDGVPEAMKITALRAMAGARLQHPPELWSVLLSRLIRESQGELRRQALRTARLLQTGSGRDAEYQPTLRLAALDTSLPLEARMDALAAYSREPKPLEADLFRLAQAALDGSQPLSLRDTAGAVLARAKLDEQQLYSLADTIEKSGPLELPNLFRPFARATNEALGLRLVQALTDARSFRSLRAEQVRPNLTNFPATVRAKADALLATLNTDAAKQKARLDELCLNLKEGDVRRGQALFNSQKAACSTCHAIGYLGGNLGPDLTKIGQIRTERDLLEAVVYPSASFVRSYEPMLVVTRSGDEQSGILRRDAPDEVVIATGPNAEVRIPRADIVEMRPGTVSVMPQGLDELLTRQELADLVAFLKATKW